MGQYLQTSEMADFRSFLESGKLGSLSNKPTIEEVYQFFGQPIIDERNTNVIRDSNFTRLYYDNLEVRYIDETFFQLAIYFRNTKKTDNSVERAKTPRILWYNAVRKMSFDEITKLLKSNSISCKRVVFSMPEDDAGLTIEIIATGIWISFADLTRIDCIHYTPSRPGEFEYMAL